MVTVRCWLLRFQRTSRPVSNPRTAAGSLVEPDYTLRKHITFYRGSWWGGEAGEKEAATVLQRAGLMRHSRQTSRLFSVDLWFKSRLNDWLSWPKNFVSFINSNQIMRNFIKLGQDCFLQSYFNSLLIIPFNTVSSAQGR